MNARPARSSARPTQRTSAHRTTTPTVSASALGPRHRTLPQQLGAPLVPRRYHAALRVEAQAHLPDVDGELALTQEGEAHKEHMGRA